MARLYRVGIKSIFLFAIAFVPANGLAQSGNDAPQHPTAACADLMNLRAPSVEIRSAGDQPPMTLPGGPGGAPPVSLPAHCLIKGAVDQRTGVGGKPYGIRFEMRLPLDWNGRFLFQGGGGLNGEVHPATGSVKGPAALGRGYAVVSQDGGHEGADASFGEDQQARIDMIYRSYERVTGIAKQLIAAYYGKPADHSYFMGCSEGGREALLAAQRMPLEYDGVVAGDPGFLLGVSFDDIANRMEIARIVPKGADGQPDYAKAFSDSDLALFEKTIEADCDAKDGLKDGLIDNPLACRPNLERLICKAGRKTPQCLSATQVHALRAIFDGGLAAGANVATKGSFYDTAVDLPAWRGNLAGFGGLRVPGVSSTQGFFITPYDPGFDDSAVDFKKNGARFAEVGSLNRVDGVDYSSFRQHGGRLLIYTGAADQAFSAKTLVGYYRHLADTNNGAAATAAFARLFLAPGMTHCRGGKALDEFDPLAAVVDWVEKNKPPEKMIATGRAFAGRSRPLCAFPSQSRYIGTGSIEDAANFVCRDPATSN